MEGKEEVHSQILQPPANTTHIDASSDWHF